MEALTNKSYDVEQLRAIGNSAVAQAAGIAHVPTHQLLALLDDLKAAQETLREIEREYQTHDAAAIDVIADIACKALEGVKS